MKNYTATEIQVMQQQAIERVREMQRRSKFTAENTESVREIPDPPPRIPDAPKHSSLPLNLPERTRKTQQTEEKTGFPNIEKDTALILALVLLLSGEGADTELILALLYIMF